MSAKLDKMKQQRERLNAEIRAAKRAETKRRRSELLAARHALGVWLADSFDADTAEAVARVRDALDTDEVLVYLAKQLVVESSTADAQDDVANASESSYSLSEQLEEYEVHGG